jgi:hypothetical protein
MRRVSITLTGLPSGFYGPVVLDVPHKQVDAVRALVRDMLRVPVAAIEAEMTDFQDAPIGRLVRTFAESIDSVVFIGWGVLEADLAFLVDYNFRTVHVNGHPLEVA